MAHRAAARGEQPDAQLLVGGAAAAEDREAGGGRPFGVATPMTRISSGRQSPTAHSGSGSPHRSWEPTG